MRIRKVSSSTPSAIAEPSSLTWSFGPVRPATPKVAARISPAEVTGVPVAWTALATASGSLACQASSRMRIGLVPPQQTFASYGTRGAAA